jgi:hypothetical protein
MVRGGWDHGAPRLSSEAVPPAIMVKDRGTRRPFLGMSPDLRRNAGDGM